MFQKAQILEVLRRDNFLGLIALFVVREKIAKRINKGAVRMQIKESENQWTNKVWTDSILKLKEIQVDRPERRREQCQSHQ